MPQRVIAIVTDELHGSEPVEQIRACVDGEGVDVRLVVPAVEANSLRHTMGDVDEPKQEAEERLQRNLKLLREGGLQVNGEVGDPDPVQAAQDALLKAPADEVLIFEHDEAHHRWYENGLFERAQESIEPPLRMVVLECADGEPDHVVEVEEAARGTVNPVADQEVGGAYVPGMTRADLAGIVAGIVGTIVVAVLAAAATAGGQPTGWRAVAILIAIGVALVNLAHVVGLTLFESVHYHGGFAKFFRSLALVATPLAILVNLAILVFA